MPALKPTDFQARIVWMGVVTSADSIRSEPIDAMDLGFAGHEADTHAGRTRPSCSRVTSQHAKGTEIANVRQLSVLSVEEVAATAQKMGLDQIAPELLGASILLEGIPDFTHIPPSSRLQAENGTTLIVDMENRPCQFPAREIEAEHSGFGKAYKSAATNQRGVTVWVERPGRLEINDILHLHIPDQRAWAHLDAARG